MATLLPASVSRFPLPIAYKPTGTLDFQAKPGAKRKPAPCWERRPNSALRSSLAEQQSPARGGEGEAAVELQEQVEFLRGDLPHLFDERGIDRTRYDRRVQFRDPITKHDSVEGYLFNIWLLKLIFSPDFYLHRVKQTGRYEITTRWTMVMKFALLPWKPELVFSGVSIMGVNPETQKFCTHVDLWDSIQNNKYFSFEGLLDVLKQLRIYKTPDLETPKYQILKRTATYEWACVVVDGHKPEHSSHLFLQYSYWIVRKYEPFVVVETKGDKLSGSSGFNDVTGYIFGKNSSVEKIPMTTPVFTEASDDKLSQVRIQIALPTGKELDSFPAPESKAVHLRKVEGGIAAVKKFSGKATEEVVRSIEEELHSILLRDGLNHQQGCLLARYNDPGRTWSFIMRNEVLIWLKEFTLE